MHVSFAGAEALESEDSGEVPHDTDANQQTGLPPRRRGTRRGHTREHVVSQLVNRLALGERFSGLAKFALDMPRGGARFSYVTNLRQEEIKKLDLQCTEAGEWAVGEEEVVAASKAIWETYVGKDALFSQKDNFNNLDAYLDISGLDLPHKGRGDFL